MFRLRTLAPLVLSSLSPAITDIASATVCQPYNWMTAACESGVSQRLVEANTVERLAAAASHQAIITVASACQPNNWLTAACRNEAERTLAAARATTVTASIDAPAGVAANLTHCTTTASATPRCEAERAQEIAQLSTYCKEASDAATPRCEAERARELALATTHCKTGVSVSPRCEAERNREFAAAQNELINASIAAVAAARLSTGSTQMTLSSAEYAELTSHCARNSESPRCEAERIREFAAAQNALINASIAAVAATRGSKSTGTQTTKLTAAEYAELTSHCAHNAGSPRCEVERIREFAAARNAEINASVAAVRAVRDRRLAAEQNELANRTIAAVNAERARTFAAAQNALINRSIATVELTRHQNALAEASLKAVKAAREREFAARQNALINRSIAAVKAERERAFAAAQNALINRSIAMVEFNRARNAEINASIAHVMARRAIEQANSGVSTGLETGALPLPETKAPRPVPALRPSRAAAPCEAAGTPLGPVHFSYLSASVSDTMQPEFERLAEIARNCPAVQIEIHGHSAAFGPTLYTRSLAWRRAQAVRDQLTALGVDTKRIDIVDHGHGNRPVPIADKTGEGDRVEFVIKDPARDAAAVRIMLNLADLLLPDDAVARLSP
jgi:outer membrane protein OmpA-like peptidoglycan-associated protein